jgi:ATP phosphoribosyltransferase regulatory subunit
MSSQSIHQRWPLARSVGLRREITGLALEVFRGWTYHDIEIPLLDYVDLRPEVLALHDTNQSFRVSDREGNLLVMRSDVTPAIARIYARQLRGLPLPLRVCYANRVVRANDGAGLERSESYQLGLELIGDTGLTGELEVMLICLEVLGRLGVEDFQINLSNIGIARRLLEMTGLPSAARRAVEAAVAARDPFEVREVLLRFGTRDRIAEAIASLTLLRGGADQIGTLRELLGQDRRLMEALEHVEALVAALGELGYGERLQVDLGEVHGPMYYSGLNFKVVSQRLGRELGGGGRYDELIGLFGEPTRAVGFSLGLDALLGALHAQPDEMPPLSAPAGSAVRVMADAPVEGLRQALSRRAQGLPAVVVGSSRRLDAGPPSRGGWREG